MLSSWPTELHVPVRLLGAAVSFGPRLSLSNLQPAHERHDRPPGGALCVRPAVELSTSDSARQQSVALPYQPALIHRSATLSSSSALSGAPASAAAGQLPSSPPPASRLDSLPIRPASTSSAQTAATQTPSRSSHPHQAAIAVPTQEEEELPHSAARPAGVVTPTGRRRLRSSSPGSPASGGSSSAEIELHRTDQIAGVSSSSLIVEADSRREGALPTSLGPPASKRRKRSHRQSRDGDRSMHSNGSTSAEATARGSADAASSSPRKQLHHRNGSSSANGGSTGMLPRDEAMASNGVGNGREHGNGDGNNGSGAMAGPSSSRGFYPIYPGSQIDQQELVRLTLQCLQDAGYPSVPEQHSRPSLPAQSTVIRLCDEQRR